MIVNMNEIPIEKNNNIEVTLPFYEPDSLPTTKWPDYTAEQSVNLTVRIMILLIGGKIYFN